MKPKEPATIFKIIGLAFVVVALFILAAIVQPGKVYPEEPPLLPCRLIGQYTIDFDVPADVAPVLMVQVVDPETGAVIAHDFTQSANLGQWIRLDIDGTQQITLADALAILRMQAGVK